MHASWAVGPVPATFCCEARSVLRTAARPIGGTGRKSGLIRPKPLRQPDHPPQLSPLGSRGYLIPSCLRDLVMVDMLELTGTTTAAAEQLGVSQSSVSRRYRSVAHDLDLVHAPDAAIGLRYGNTTWLRTLRQGLNGHRLSRGVLRLGASAALWNHCKPQPWCHWVGLPPAVLKAWPRLFEEELLDGVLLASPIEPDDSRAMHQVRLPIGFTPLSSPWLIYRADVQVSRIVSAISGSTSNRSD